MSERHDRNVTPCCIDTIRVVGIDAVEAARSRRGTTVLVFSDRTCPSVRTAALMQLSVVFVFTHDSMGLGEDGPTHRRVEHLTSLPAVPHHVARRAQELVAQVRRVAAPARAA